MRRGNGCHDQALETAAQLLTCIADSIQVIDAPQARDAQLASAEEPPEKDSALISKRGGVREPANPNSIQTRSRKRVGEDSRRSMLRSLLVR